MLLATHFGQHPGPAGHRRLVTHMLSVATGQIGHPMTLLVLVISNDRLVHSGGVVVHGNVDAFTLYNG